MEQEQVNEGRRKAYLYLNALVATPVRAVETRADLTRYLHRAALDMNTTLDGIRDHLRDARRFVTDRRDLVEQGAQDEILELLSAIEDSRLKAGRVSDGSVLRALKALRADGAITADRLYQLDGNLRVALVHMVESSLVVCDGTLDTGTVSITDHGRDCLWFGERLLSHL